MAYRSLGIGCKGYIIEQSLLDWQFVYICRNCQAATETVRSISQIEHKTAKNETDERESKCLARRRGMSEGQNQFRRQGSVSFHYLEHAGFLLQLPRSKQSFLFRHAESFPHLLSYQRNIAEDRQWSLTNLICKKTEAEGVLDV